MNTEAKTSTAVVIDFATAKRAAKNPKASSARRQATVGIGPRLSATQRQRRDEVRIAAKASL